MCVALSELLESIGIEWDPKKCQISCMNHVINLAVQEFIKSVKVMIEGEDNTTAAGFARAMYKIRTITKVQDF